MKLKVEDTSRLANGAVYPQSNTDRLKAELQTPTNHARSETGAPNA